MLFIAKHRSLLYVYICRYMDGFWKEQGEGIYIVIFGEGFKNLDMASII